MASLEICAKIPKAFRDTLKGPLTITREEIWNIKFNKPSIKEDESSSNDLSLQEGYSEYFVKNGDELVFNWWMSILKFDIPEEIITKCF